MIQPPRNSRAFGELQERRIIDALRRQPMNEFDLAKLLGITRNATTIYMTRMRKQKRIRVCAWIKNKVGRPLPIFGAGCEPDVEYVPVRYRNKVKQPDRVETMRAAVLELLKARHTAAELGEKLHRSQSVMRSYVRGLRKEKLAHIAAWQQTGERNGWAPVYKAGNAPDVPQPPRETIQERHERERASAEFRQRENERRRERYRLKALCSKPQGIFAALGL